MGANVFYTRLAGHGRGSGDWLNDMVEALAIGRRLGDRGIVIATSTAGPLPMEALVHSALFLFAPTDRVVQPFLTAQDVPITMLSLVIS